MQGAGIPIVDLAVYDEETDPNRIMGRLGGYVEKIAWSDERVQRPARNPGGSIERYVEEADAIKRAEYLSAFDGGILGDGYRYRNGGLLLRLSKSLTPTQARDYEAALGIC